MNYSFSKFIRVVKIKYSEYFFRKIYVYKIENKKNRELRILKVQKAYNACRFYLNLLKLLMQMKRILNHFNYKTAIDSLIFLIVTRFDIFIVRVLS